jgi:hypothetical protein
VARTVMGWTSALTVRVADDILVRNTLDIFDVLTTACRRTRWASGTQMPPAAFIVKDFLVLRPLARLVEEGLLEDEEEKEGGKGWCHAGIASLSMVGDAPGEFATGKNRKA